MKARRPGDTRRHLYNIDGLGGCVDSGWHEAPLQPRRRAYVTVQLSTPPCQPSHCLPLGLPDAQHADAERGRHLVRVRVRVGIRVGVGVGVRVGVRGSTSSGSHARARRASEMSEIAADETDSRLVKLR